MTEPTAGMAGDAGPYATPPEGAQPPAYPPAQQQYAQPAHAQYGQPPQGYQQPGYGPIGRTRGTGVTMLLMVVTLGIYSLVWYYQVHDEMKRHSGQGLGGGLALVITLLAGFVTPFLTSSEVGKLYERRGQSKPVSGTTGLWVIPGFLLIVGPIVWFVKTNGALNNYWRSLGAH